MRPARSIVNALRSCLFTLIVGVLCAPVLFADEVTIVRDTYGVPHIFSESDPGAAYGLAIAQCEDDLYDVLYCLHLGVGRLAEMLGPSYLPQDIQARTLRHAVYAERDWNKLSPELRAIIQAFCDGVNDYLQQHPRDLPELRTTPIVPVQVIAWHRWLFQLAAVGIARQDAEASAKDGYHPLYNPGVKPGKSNSWALAGSKTAAGVPMLLLDPHFRIEGFLNPYESHLYADRLTLAGFSLIGTPLAGIGVTPYAAWTVTAGGADSSDAYALRINPDNPDQYQFDGRWVDMDVREETIRIREADGYRSETIKVRETRHGPVLKTEAGEPFAASYLDYYQADAMEQSYRMAVARNYDDFRRAVAMDRLTYFNLMWITRDGHIGYLQTGDAPLRPQGFDWERLVPGWTSDALYKGKLPVDRLPHVEDPPTGFLQNCNVAANVVTTGLKFDKGDFPPGILYGHYGAYRARGQRATRLLSEVKKATIDDARRIAFDTYVLPADIWVPIILAAYDQSAPTPGSSAEFDQQLIQAVELLRQWDRFATKNSTGATVFRFWRYACNTIDSQVGRDSFEVKDSPELRSDALAALRAAVKRMAEYYGTVAVPWGEIKRLRRADHEWPLSGDGLGMLGMDTLRATAAVDFDDQHKLIPYGGQCVTTIALLTDPPTLHTVVAYGQSKRPESRHYFDQAPLYSGEQFRNVPWGREQLESQIESKATLHFTPGR